MQGRAACGYRATGSRPKPPGRWILLLGGGAGLAVFASPFANLASMVVRIEGQHDRRHEDDVELEVEHLLVDTTKSIDEISSRHDCSRRARMGRRASAAASGAHRRSRVAGDIPAAAASNDASHGDGGEENEGACRWRLSLRQALRRVLARPWRRRGIFALSFLIVFWITCY